MPSKIGAQALRALPLNQSLSSLHSELCTLIIKNETFRSVLLNARLRFNLDLLTSTFCYKNTPVTVDSLLQLINIYLSSFAKIALLQIVTAAYAQERIIFKFSLNTYKTL